MPGSRVDVDAFGAVDCGSTTRVGPAGFLGFVENRLELSLVVSGRVGRTRKGQQRDHSDCAKSLQHHGTSPVRVRQDPRCHEPYALTDPFAPQGPNRPYRTSTINAIA